MAEDISDKRKRNFIDQFQKFAGAFNNGTYKTEMVSIVFVDGKVSYDISSMYERYLGKYLNETENGKPTKTASWCRSLRSDLQKHDKKYSPKYLELKKKIRVFRKNINLEGSKKFRIIREIKNIFKSRKKELETLQNSAKSLFEDATTDLKVIFNLYSQGKLNGLDDGTLIFACNDEIKPALNITALNSDPLIDVEKLYNQLKLPKEREIDDMEKSFIRRISSGNNKKIESSSEKESKKFQLAVSSFFSSFSDSGRYKTSLTPIIFKPKKGNERYKSIAAVFKEYFGSFFYKHRILSPTSDWCHGLYEDLRAHGMKYERKYREIRKKIGTTRDRNNDAGNDIIETSGAFNTFTEARRNLSNIFYNSLSRLKNSISLETRAIIKLSGTKIPSTVYKNLNLIKNNIDQCLSKLQDINKRQLFKELRKNS